MRRTGVLPTLLTVLAACSLTLSASHAWAEDGEDDDEEKIFEDAAKEEDEQKKAKKAEEPKDKKAPAKDPTKAETAGDEDDEDEEKLFEDDPADGDTKKDGDAEKKADGDAKKDSDGKKDEEDAFFRGDVEDIGLSPDVFKDKLVIGGQMYLRLSGFVVDEGSAAEQRLSMPNLVDLYLDARPVDRLRAYVRGRLLFDPTIDADGTDFFGNPAEPLRVILDQLWLKTDVSRIMYVTVGAQRIRWGESRLWNPTDFLNRNRLDPLAFFDIRTGVNMLKLHFPIEELDWNIYLVGLLDGVSQWDRAGGAARVEMTIGPTEWSVSFAAGHNMATSIGVGVSAPIWDFDFNAEFAISNERRTKYTGAFEPTIADFANCGAAIDDPTVIPGCLNPPSRQLDGWFPRVSGGLTYAFRYNDGQDLMLLGVEYFYNSTGYENADPYPWAILGGGFEPFWMGQHYGGIFWSIPAPGNLDELTITTSTLGNLSDMSFISRLDFTITILNRLRLEVFAMVHYGTPGGEFRFELNTPASLEDVDLKALGVPVSRVPMQIFDWGVNLRLAI